MKKDKKLTTLVVTLAIAAALVMGLCLIGCNSEPEYTVSFTGGGTLVSGTAPTALKKKEGEKITLPDNTFTYEGHAFAGWKYGNDTYAVGDEFTVAKSDVEFVAQWTEVAKYTVTYVGGEGATGTVAAVSKEEGATISLAAANSFTKADSTFVGWSDGTNLYAAGATFTVGNADVTLTAQWFDNGTYNEALSDYTPISVTYNNGKMAFTEAEIETVYSLNFAGNKVTFVSETNSDDKYIGYYADGVIFVNCKISHESYTGMTTVLVSKDAAIFVDDLGGTNGQSAITTDFSLNLYLYTNGIFLCKDYSLVTLQFGKYVKQDGIYSGTSVIDGRTYDYNVTPGTSSRNATFVASDGFKGSYKIGSKTITLDGFGHWADGTYLACSNGGTSLVRVTDTVELTEKYYFVEGENLVELGGAKAGVYKKYNSGAQVPFTTIIYDGKNFVAAILLGEGDEDNEAPEILKGYTLENGNGTITEDYTNYTVEFTDDFFAIGNSYIDEPAYYSIGGVKVDGIPDVKAIENGTYVNNLDSTITATVAMEGDEQILTLTQGSTTTKHIITSTTKKIKFTQQNNSRNTAEGDFVNGVLMIFGIKVGSSSKAVALSKTALNAGSVTASSGYFVTSASTSHKLYVFDGVAVYLTYASSGRAGTCSINANDEITITYSYKSTDTATYKLFADADGSPAHFVSKDSVVGTYTIGSDTYVLDGYGTYTKGGETGKYIAGPNGFTILTDANEIGKKYSIGSGNVLEEVVTATVQTDVICGTTGNTYKALQSVGIEFSSVYKVYEGTGCVDITYKYNEENITISIVFGYSYTIGDYTFTVTQLDEHHCTLKFSGKIGNQTLNTVQWSNDGF